jgi:hypothetical protein
MKIFANKTDYLAIILVLSLFLFAGIRSLHEFRWSYWAYGDAQMLNAGIHFRDEGFLKHNFLPLVNPGYIHDMIPNNFPNGRYSHYPALHAVIIGILGKYFDNPLYPARIMAVFFGSLSSFFWYLLVRNVFGGRVALISLFFIVFSVNNLEFIDALCGQPYDEFFRFSIIYLFLFLESDSISLQKHNRNLLIFLIWMLLILASLNSVEYILYLYLFIAGYYIFAKNFKKSFGRVILFFIAPVVGLSLHFIQTSIEYGSIKEVLVDWINTFTNRMTSQSMGAHVGVQNNGIILYFQKVGILFWYLSEYLFNHYKMVILSFLIFIALISYKEYRSFSNILRNKEAKIWILLCLCGISFYIIFPYHAYNMRDYIFKHVFPSVAILFGISGAFFINSFVSHVGKNSETKKKIFFSIIYIVPFYLMLNPFIHSGEYIARYPNLLGSPRWAIDDKTLDDWKDRISQAEMIKNHTKAGDIILVPNDSRGNSDLEGNPIEEYYAQRRLLPLGGNNKELINRIDRLFAYRKEFVKKEPGLQEARFFVFVDRSRVAKNVLRNLYSYFPYKELRDEKGSARFIIFVVAHIPKAEVRRDNILSSAIAFWNLDDFASEKLSDANGKYTAIANNTRIIEGVGGKGRWLNGKDAYIGTTLNLNDWSFFSIALWVRSEVKEKDEIAIILDNGHNVKGNFVVQSNDNLETSFSWIYGTKITFEIPNNKWTHLVVTADGIDKRIKVYVNGMKIGDSQTPVLRKPDSTPLTFGKWSNGDRYFKGGMDEIGVWDYVLDDDDVKVVYDSKCKIMEWDRER